MHKINSQGNNMKYYPRVGVGVLIFNKQHEILLGKRAGSHGAHTWCNPGGHLEYGESFAACAIREVKEETNIIIVDPVLVGITNDIFSDENKHYISIFMQADYPPNQPLVNLEPHKTTEFQWFSLDNLPKQLFLPFANLLKQQPLLLFKKTAH